MANVDLQHILARGVSNTSESTPGGSKPFSMDTTTPWTTFVYACPKTSPPKTKSGASSPGCPQNGAFSHKWPLTSCSATISSTHDACSEIKTRPTTTTLPSRHPSRPATQGNLSAVTVLNLLQKCVVHFCSQFNIVTGASAPPPLPSSSCAFANRAPPSFRSRPGCASPTGSTSPFAPGLAPTPSRTHPPTLTSRPCPNYDCTSRSAWSKSFSPLKSRRSSTKHLTSVAHNRTWMPTLTPIWSLTSA